MFVPVPNAAQAREILYKEGSASLKKMEKPVWRPKRRHMVNT